MVLGLIAFVGVASTEIFRRIELTAARNRQASFSDEVEILVGSLTTQLKAPESCTTILNGVSLVPGTAVVPTVAFRYGEALNSVFSQGAEVSNGIVVNDVKLLSATGPDMHTRISDAAGNPGPLLSRYPVRLDMVFGGKMPSVVPVNRTGLRGIAFFAWTDPSGKILACFGGNSIGAMCNSVGGYYLVN